MHYAYEDYEIDRPATHSEAMQEYALYVGQFDRHKNSAWILTDYDVWVTNPHYRGPPQRHPEDDDPFFTDDAIDALLPPMPVVRREPFVGPPEQDPF